MAVLCQKTPTRPMCSCSLLLYISTHTCARTHTHSHTTESEREEHFNIMYVDLMLRREITRWKLMLQKTQGDVCCSSETTTLFKCEKIVAAL